MKRFIYSALACGAVLSLASCASDEPLTPGNGDGVQLTISLPDAMMTRASNAFGDGLDAVNLTYAVYNSKGTLIMSETKANFFDGTNLTNTLSLDLLNGETYNIIFWADAFGAGDTESPFIFSTDDKTVTVNYLKMGANSEKYDAFYASDDLTVNGPVSKTIKLYRPFAQINFGTNDLDKPAVTKEFGENWANLQTTYTVSGLANTLNLATGAVSQNTDYGTSYSAAVGIPTGQAFPKVTVNGQTVTGLNYLQMDYILAGKGTNDIAEFDLEIANSDSKKVFNTIKVPNAPYQANYRTNIYGQLLTTTNDFVVEIVPIFETPDYNMQIAIWDGKTVENPVIDATAKTATVSTPAQFAGLAKMVNEGNNFEGYTVVINNNMDFNNFEFPMLFPTATRASNSVINAFNGKINGNGYTFKNVKIGNAAGGDNASAVFGAIAGEGNGVENLNFENLTINNTTGEQSGVVGMLTGGATVKNVNVLSGSISGTEGVGAIVGRLLVDGTIENCSNNATINGTSTNVGGIVGAAYYTAIGKEMHITGCVNMGSVNADRYCTGGIVGLSAAFITDCTNKGAVESKSYQVGGIAGYQVSAGGIKNCHNEANITCGIRAAGGIVGLVQYVGGSAYANMNVITIEGCTNSGNIKGEADQVGGIAGGWNKSGYVKGCTNTATSLIGTNFVAGLVGLQGLAYDTPAGATETLFVTGNTTTTTLDQMTGATKALLINYNGWSDVEISGNTPENNQ